jgi:hypothetical protein
LANINRNILLNDISEYSKALNPKGLLILSGFYQTDLETVSYEAKVIMSNFNIQTQEQTQVIREPFYIKSMKVVVKGSCNLDIINSERNTTIVVDKKHLDRRLFIGGNSEKINIGFSSSYSDGCEIDTLSIEGRIEPKSKNV